jgi:hypothetical protein
MVRTHRVSKIAVTACLVCAPCLNMPVAAQTPSSSAIHVDQAAPQSRFTLKEPLTTRVTSDPAPPNLFADAEWGQRDWGYGHHHRNSGARAAIILGSVAAVAGAAVLVYANRPECGANHAAGGCGYGTKVAGGAVLAGGVLGITIGAVTWR